MLPKKYLSYKNIDIQYAEFAIHLASETCLILFCHRTMWRNATSRRIDTSEFVQELPLFNQQEVILLAGILVQKESIASQRSDNKLLLTRWGSNYIRARTLVTHPSNIQWPQDACSMLYLLNTGGLLKQADFKNNITNPPLMLGHIIKCNY